MTRWGVLLGLALGLVGCAEMPRVQPSTVYSGYRTAVQELGTALADYKKRTEQEVVRDIDTFLAQCESSYEVCHTGAKQMVSFKYGTIESNFNKVQGIHRDAVIAADLVDSICSKQNDVACKEAQDNVAKDLPRILQALKEVK